MGTDKTVTATGTSLTGADANNYTLAPSTLNDLADITAITLVGNNTDNDVLSDALRDFLNRTNDGTGIFDSNGKFVLPRSGGVPLFPLRQGINTESTPFAFLSWAASRSFQSGENSGDDDEDDEDE